MPRITSVLATLTCGAVVLLAPALRAQAPAQPGVSGEPAHAFAVRVDPRLATRVNRVLARLAQDMEVTLPKGTTAGPYLDRLCGGRQPVRSKEVTAEDSSTRLRFSPCVWIRRNVELVVDRNNTLAGFAARNGLPASAASTWTIKPAPGSDAKRVVTPETLQPKDRVLVPELPQWTAIETNPEKVRDRSTLVVALATEIGCPQEQAEACLVQRGVAVLDRGVVKPSAPQREPDEVLQASRDVRAASVARDRAARSVEASRRAGDVDRITRVPARPMARAGAAAATARAAPPPPPPPPPPLVAASAPAATPPAPVAAAATVPAAAAAAAAALADDIPVAPEQWPYDAKLLAAILEHTATNHLREGIVIGVADGALAGASGAPLAPDVFDPVREDSPEPDDDDDDGNNYVDDLLGGGPFRGMAPGSTTALGSGDVGVCNAGPPAFGSWKPKSVETASHGLIVASIAAGQPVRTAKPAVASKLPKIAFYRMLSNVCADDAEFGDVAEGDMVLAFDYLEWRSQIINVSYRIDTSRSNDLVRSMKDNLTTSNKLLVLPSGNDEPGDLDKPANKRCPACLGDSRLGSTLPLRTVVVGSASRELRVESFSNFGANTVWLYAPGQARGALDITGADASALAPATSYSAPYAALAAGLMWSLGIDDVKRVKDRLDVATWPLFQASGRSDPALGGVLDLVKAAAVRLHAIDVRETESDGTQVRRTYVGALVDPLQQQSLCAGKTFARSKVQALRFETSAFGDRQVRIYPRDLHDSLQHKWTDGESCTLPPAANVRFKTLFNEDKTFPVSAVMQIQLPWTTTP